MALHDVTFTFTTLQINVRKQRNYYKRKEISFNSHKKVVILSATKHNYYGRSYLYAPDAQDGNFIVKSNKSLIIGEFVKVKISSVDAYDVKGEL